MTDGPDRASFVALVRAVATDLLGRRDELNRLDAVAGDGDLGLTASAAAEALLAIGPTLEALPEAEAIRKAGLEVARRAPSTGGTLIAFGLLAAAKTELAPGTPAVERAAACVEAAAAAIAERGEVGPGDRTLVDALLPAAEALRRAADAASGAAVAARAAAEAADRGAGATAAMTARVGRAGWLANRAAGHEDAGARLVALAFAAAAEAVRA